MNRRMRSLVADAVLLALILVGGAGAVAQAGTAQSVFAELSQSVDSAAPGDQIVYHLQFTNTGDTTIHLPAMVFTWQAPAHTHKISGSADFGASVAPHSSNTASLTVQVDNDAPDGARLTMAAYPTDDDGESMLVFNDPQVVTVVAGTVGRPSSISITAPTSVTWPAKAKIGGKVSTASASYAGQPADLLTADRNTSRRASVVTAGAAGALSRQLQLTRQTSVWWTAGGKTSALRSVAVKPALNAHRSAASVGHGGTITISGRTTPVRKGAAIALQRRVNGAWTTVRTIHASAGSTSTSLSSGTPYSFKVTRPDGSYVFRVHVPGDDGRLAATTAAMTLTFG